MFLSISVKNTILHLISALPSNQVLISTYYRKTKNYNTNNIMHRPQIHNSSLPLATSTTRPSTAGATQQQQISRSPSLFAQNKETDPKFAARLQSSLTPSVLQNTRGLSALASSASSRKSTSISLFDENNNNNTNTNKRRQSSLAGAALSAIRGVSSDQENSKKSKNHAQASPELLRTWREPFQALQRLVDRSHEQQLEEARRAAGLTNSSPSSSSANNRTKYARRFGNMIVQSRIGEQHQNQSSSDQHSFSFVDGRLQFLDEAKIGGGGQNDPLNQLDRLYSKAKRKWIDLCVTLRVPEEERQLIEKQIYKRDTLQEMNTALSILHSEIERLIDLYHWSGVLRKSIEEREKVLAQFLKFISDVTARFQADSSANANQPPLNDLGPMMMKNNRQNNGNNNNNSSPLARSFLGNNNSTSRQQQQNTSSNMNTNIPLGNPMSLSPSEICVKILEKLLQLRYLSADVFTAHRRWQVAHGATNSSSSTAALFVFKGTSYLEKMMQDVVSLIETDTPDMHRAIDREKRRNERINHQFAVSASAGGNDLGDDVTPQESGRFGPESSRNTTARSTSASSSARGGTLSGRSKHRQQQQQSKLSSIVGSNLSPAERRKKLQAQQKAVSESQVIRQFPDWLFSLILFRLSRQNCFLDTRKRRSLPMLAVISGNDRDNELEKDFDDNDKFQQKMLHAFLNSSVQQKMEKADDELSELLHERCKWTIDDYYQSATRAASEIKISWKFASEVLKKNISEIVVDPKSLGVVRTEFLRDFEAGCEFVVEHEKQTVDNLVQKSIQQGMYGSEEQQEQFNRLVEEHQARQQIALGGGDGKSENQQQQSLLQNRGRSRSTISSLVEASHLSGVNNPLVHQQRSHSILSASSGSLFNNFSDEKNSSSTSPTRNADVNSVAHQMMCIVKIQKKIRTHLARKVARKLWQEKIAATIMQSWIRRFICQCRVARMRRRWKAAARIQAFYRACVVRREIRDDLRQRREAREKSLHRHYLDTKKSTPSDPNRILIVANQTMMVSPKRGEFIATSGKTLRQYLTEKATKIQAAYRGYREYRHGAGEAVHSWRMVLHINSAAARIQALVRGVLVRKEAAIVKKILDDVTLMQRVGRGFLTRRKYSL